MQKIQIQTLSMLLFLVILSSWTSCVHADCYRAPIHSETQLNNMEISSKPKRRIANKKIYVDLKDLIINSEGFWLSSPIGSAILGSTSLSIDGHGYYLNPYGVRWICSFCGEINEDISNNTCINCERSSLDDAG